MCVFEGVEVGGRTQPYSTSGRLCIIQDSLPMSVLTFNDLCLTLTYREKERWNFLLSRPKPIASMVTIAVLVVSV